MCWVTRFTLSKDMHTSKGNLLIGVIVAILIIAGTGSSYYAYKKFKPHSNPGQNKSTVDQTKIYRNDRQGLEIHYSDTIWILLKNIYNLGDTDGLYSVEKSHTITSKDFNAPSLPHPETAIISSSKYSLLIFYGTEGSLKKRDCKKYDPAFGEPEIIEEVQMTITKGVSVHGCKFIYIGKLFFIIEELSFVNPESGRVMGLLGRAEVEKNRTTEIFNAFEDVVKNLKFYKPLPEKTNK